MIPWKLLDSAKVPGSGEELRLYNRDKEFSIRVNGCELMNSRAHGSEDALAELACAKIADRQHPHVLIGGLGMGYTTAAALRHLKAGSNIVVAELVPAVVEWNRGPLAELAGAPLQDPRVTVREADIAVILRSERRAYDAILLDVDNGPAGLTRKCNDWLYSEAGLASAHSALKPAGVYAVWSAAPDNAFTNRLSRAGFEVSVVNVRSRGSGRGGRHTIWLAIAEIPAKR
jgi:spermidine synthase